MCTHQSNRSIFLLFFLFLACFPLASQQQHYSDFAIPFVQRAWKDSRKNIFQSLPPEQRAIEATITYEFVESNDPGLVRAVIEDNERKIKVSTGYCKAIFRLMDLFMVEEFFFEGDKDELVYGDYLFEMFPKPIADWESPESFEDLTIEQETAFNNETNAKTRFNLYVMLLYITLAHEVYHHINPDHLSLEKAKTIAEKLSDEREADAFAMDLLKHAELPIFILAAVHGKFYLEFDFYRQVNQLERTHPSGLERILQAIGYSIRYFDDVQPLLTQGGVKLSRQKIYEQFREGYLEILRDQLKSQRLPLRYYEQLAGEGNLEATFKIGYANWLGLGRQPVDLEAADTYLRNAADGGYGIAQFVYALFLQFEYGKADAAYIYLRLAWANNMPLSNDHIVLMERYSKKRMIRKGKKLPGEVADIRARCMNTCTEHFGNSLEDCRERYCKNHVGNVDAWVRRFWREGE